jgi:hypothetical protein
MGRLRRFSDNRYLGVRDEMIFYDCDDEEQYAAVAALVEEGDLIGRLGVQTFAPDTPAEARNRGFRPHR